jgi:hypothetical protein
MIYAIMKKPKKVVDKDTSDESTFKKSSKK